MKVPSAAAIAVAMWRALAERIGREVAATVARDEIEAMHLAERAGDPPPAMRAPVARIRERTDEWATWRCENCGLLAGVHMDTAEACPRCRRGSFVQYGPDGPCTEHERKRHGAPPRHRRRDA